MTTKSLRDVAAAAAAMAVVLAGCSCDNGPATQGVGPRLEVRLFETGTAPAEGTELANDAVLDFGVVKLNRPDRRNLALRNGGSAALNVQMPVLEKGTEYKLVETLVPCAERAGEPTAIPIGECSTFAIEYTPTAVGDHTDVLIIRSDDKDREEVQIKLVGRGATGRLEACIASTPAFDALGTLNLCSSPDRKELYIDYGSVPMNAGDVKRKLRVSNVGELPLDIASIKPGPDSPIDFAVEPYDFAGTISKGESVDLIIVFRPSDVGDRKGVIIVDADDPFGAPVEIKLASRGDAPRLCIEPNPVDFGNVGNGHTLVKDVALQNCGSKELDIANLSLEGDSSFTIHTAPSGTTIPAGGIKLMKVEFKPTSLGPKNGRLRIASNDPVTPVAFGALIGNGFAAPQCDLRPATYNVDFGVVVMNNTLTKSIFFNNAGSVECNVTGIRIDANGANAKFIVAGAPLAGPTSPHRIPPAGLLKIDVGYMPMDVTGPDTGFLEVLADDPKLGGQPQRVALKGEPASRPECRLTINPGGTTSHNLRFGASAVGDKKTLTVTLKNDGGGDCQLGKPTFSLLTDTSAFSFGAANPSFPATLPPGQVATLDVNFQPRSETSYFSFTNTFTMQTNETINGVGSPTQCGSGGPAGCKKFGLDGSGVKMAIDVVPGTVDFGVVTVGCNSIDKTVTVYNIGGASVTISDVSIDPVGSPFTVVSKPAMPHTVGAGGSFNVTVRYRPGSPSTDTALLTISHNFSNGQNTVPLRGSGSTSSHQIDNFQQNSQPKTDVLWVVDNSCSMADKQSHLSTNAQSFITSANATNGDYQVAVISVDNPSTSPSRADSHSSYPGTSIVAGEFFGTPKIIKRSDPDPAGALAKNIKVGQCCTDASENGLEAAKIALSNPLLTDPTKPNSTFLRPDAKLAIIVLSDEEDQSSGTVQYYVDYFQNLKGAKNTNLFAWHSIVGDAPSGCNRSSISAAAGRRYIEASTRSNGIFRSICATDWGRIANDIGLDAFAAKTQFFLTRTANPATLQVTVDGAVKVRNVDYDFDSNTNSIVFRTASVPPAGANIKAEYDTLCL